MALRRVAFAFGCLALAGSGAAQAAEIARNWSGSYAGLFAGYGRGDARATAPFDSGTGFFYNFTGSSYTADLDGFFGGATLGHNWQWGATVAGVEADVGYLGLRGSAIDPNLPATPDTETTFRSDFFAALNARLGYATGPMLLYVKGGGALLNARASTLDPVLAPPANTTTLSMNGREVMFGWTVGGGVEWALGPAWSAKLDYAYFDFGTIGTAGPSSVAGEFYRQSIDVTAHTVRLGVNHRFGAPAPASARISLK